MSPGCEWESKVWLKMLRDLFLKGLLCDVVFRASLVLRTRLLGATDPSRSPLSWESPFESLFLRASSF